MITLETCVGIAGLFRLEYLNDVSEKAEYVSSWFVFLNVFVCFRVIISFKFKRGELL